MNPFNQTRFRGEHELGRAYMDVRRAVENLADIKLVADNIKNLRAGNIELSSEGSVLKWKYVNGAEWFDLVDLGVITVDLEEAIDTINGTLQNFNNQLNNFNGIVSNHGSQLSSLTPRVGAVEAFESRIALLESAITSLTSRVEALENAGGGE